MNRQLPGPGDFSPPDDDDGLIAEIERIAEEEIVGIEEDIGERENVAEMVKALADASDSGLIRMIASGRALDDRDLIPLQAFRALARLADRLAHDRAERVANLAESNIKAARDDVEPEDC